MLTESIYKSCTLCPRECHADRTISTGFCGAGHELRAARAALHMWEEPCISGTTGSGTVFFSGCTLRCVFCQNFQLSHENYGKTISVSRLSDIFLELQEKGAANINLVTGTQFAPSIMSISGFRISNTWTAVSQKNTPPHRTILKKLPLP